MKRTFFIPLVSALIGGGVVVAVVAAAGDLGSSQKTVTVVQPASTPIAPSNASVKSVGLTPHQIYERDAPGVAYVTSTIVQQTESPFFFGGESQSKGTATGSGILINSNGTVLTNYHVIENAVKVTVSFEHGKTIEAKVIGKDPSNDLAVLKVSTEGLANVRPLQLGDSSAAQVGDPVLAIGNPFDLERTLTTGVVSALQRHIEAPNGFQIDNVLQTDAPINPGNSGGPLLNAAGEVIGINSQIETAGGNAGSVGIGFSIPINTAKSELPKLEQGGTVSRAYLGLESLTIDGSLAGLNLPVKQGALVQEVQSGTAAEKAGIRGGDISVAVDGKKVTSAEDLGNDIVEKKPGDKISVELIRSSNGSAPQHKTVDVTLGSRPNSLPSREHQPSQG
jgi:S1-C subfamily serine protease